jgi:hypothetical protein
MLYRYIIIFTLSVFIASCTGTLVEPPEVVFSENTLVDNHSRTNVIKDNYLYQLREDRVLVYEILPNNSKVLVNSFAAVDAAEIEMFDQYLGVITLFENEKNINFYDLSLPSTPISEHSTTIGTCQNIAIKNGVCYITQNRECFASSDSAAGLILVEYKYARKNSTFPSPPSFDIASYNNYIYTVSAGAGIIVYDATDSINLKEVDRININTTHFAIENKWLHAKDDIFIHHLDLSDPSKPELAGKTRL